MSNSFAHNKRNEGVSEVIAAILLISLVVLGIAIVAVLLISQPPPHDIPKTNIQIINNSEDQNHIYFYHGGGDPLPKNLTKFIADGLPVSDTIEIGFPDKGGAVSYVDWSDNPNFLWNYSSIVRIAHQPKTSYQIHYRGGSGDYLIKEFGVGRASTGIIENPDVCGGIPFATFTPTKTGDFSYSFNGDTNPTTYHDWTIIGTSFKSKDPSFNYEFAVPDSDKRVYPVQHVVYNLTNGSQSCIRSSTEYITVECPDSKCSVDFEYANDYFTITDPDPTDPNLTEVKWDFGDGTYSTEKHPKKDIFNDGKDEHLITLSIKWDRCGQDFSCSITKKVAIDTVCGCFRSTYDETTHGPNWVVNFQWDAPHTPNSECNGINTTSDWLVTFDWGDGSKQTFYKRIGLGTPIWSTNYPHSYSLCGEYSVKMSVMDLTKGREYYSCVRTVSIPCLCGIYSPVANFSVNFDRDTLEAAIIDSSRAAAVENRTILKWEYDFGDGSPIQSSYVQPSTITHVYSDCGNYVITLTVFDSIGCWASTTRTISCGGAGCEPGDTTASFDVTPDSSNNLRFRITDSSSSVNNTLERWEWDFGDGLSAVNTSPPDPFWVEYSDCSSYPVRLRVWDDIGCWDDLIKEVSCDCPNPTAGFRIESMTNPKEFRFVDESTHDPAVSISWLWDFGDGVTSLLQNPTHRYDDFGRFTVRLKVTTDCGSWDDAVHDVVSGCPVPKAAFRYSTTADPQNFTFTDESISDALAPITLWYWEFGDGVNSTSRNPTHRYATCGQYTVRLTVTTDCGSTDDVIGDAVCGCPPPTPDFEYQCIGERTVNFTDLSRATGGSIDTRIWTFGDGTSSDLPNPVHEYTNAGTYQVSLNITTDCGSSANWVRPVTVPCCVMPTPDFTYTCLEDGNTIQFNDTTKTYGDTITSWFWDFGGVGTGTGPHPRFRFENAGIYPVNLTVTTECGASNSYIHNVSVPCICSPPLANFTHEIISRSPFTVRFADYSDPTGGTISFWNWTFGDGTTHSGQTPPDKVYDSCGEYLVNLRVTKDCVSFDDADNLVCCPVFANFSSRMEPPDGYAPVTVYFTDLTDGEPNAWEWNFGDGQTSYLQHPVHTYTDGGNYTVSLHATSPCGGNETHSEILFIGCPDVTADFSYTIITEDPFNVSFRDQSFGGEIVDWTWFFGDGTTSKEQHPYHQYAGRENYNVGLIVKNSCGNTAQTWRRIAFDCPNLTADFILNPSSGMSPLDVQFTDNSTPLEDIMSWLWFFGDGTSYYTTSPPSRNPPNHTYTKLGSYYVTLQIKNECGNPFSVVKMVNVTNPASVRGYLWNDRNMNKIRDPEESALPNWEVILQERISGVWADRDSVLTNATGDYQFTMNDVTYGAFRVKETLQPRWNVTYSYPSGDENPYSGTLLVSSTRDYNNVSFGNVRTNTSTFEFPLYFDCGEWGCAGSSGSGTIYDMNRPGQYWDYNTSYNYERQKLLYPPPYSFSHTAQGDSSFDVTIGFYARYLIRLSPGSLPPISRTYWLKYWMYNGVRTDGFTFYVPDNSDVYRPNIFFLRDDVRWFELYIPFEGSTIPYSTSSYVEAHMTGTGGSADGCSLIAPVTEQLTWSTTYGYFIGTWDNTPYEGQWITITAENDFGTGDPFTSSKNVFVDWEPVTPVITSPTNNTEVQGVVNIIATVGGHNRDTDNVRLLVDGQDVGQMVYDSLNNLFTFSLNVEPYAGKTIELVARAYPLPGQGASRDSIPVFLRAQSLLPIQANFTPDPQTGPAPLEVSFTDTSTGGPASWLWDFDDGFTSNIQNPIHIFQNAGDYLVSLTVENLQGTPSTIYHYVNATGTLHTVNLLTNRNGYLHPGYASWIVRGTGSVITVNGTEYTLNDGDRVRLDIGVPQSGAEILITGEITSFNVNGVSLTINGLPVDSGACSAIHIYDFDNYHSDLMLTVYRQSNAWINLVWDGVPVTIQNYQNLDISEIMPSIDKILELDLAPGNIYLDGRASSYRSYS